MITPKAVAETTQIVTAHIKQRDLVVASILAVPDKNPGLGRQPGLDYPRS